MKKNLFLTIIILTSGFLYSQERVSATFEAIEGKILIHYTIKGDPAKEYEVDVVLRRSGDTSFELVPDEISGNVGTGRFAGSQQTIVWHIKPEEEEQLDGEDFYFEVTAVEVKEGGSFPWGWVLGGAAVAGGAAAYFILSGDKDNGTGTTNLPGPPGRPQ